MKDFELHSVRAIFLNILFLQNSKFKQEEAPVQWISQIFTGLKAALSQWKTVYYFMGYIINYTIPAP